jgi:sirohydrochlorin cobaltochelatase
MENPDALVLFAHGARDPEWAAPFVRIRGLVMRQRPQLAIELAFLEIMQPSLAETIARLAAAGRRRVAVAPLFMAQGGHLRKDLPALVQQLQHAHPEVELELLPAVGEVESILQAIGAWLVDAVTKGNP